MWCTPVLNSFFDFGWIYQLSHHEKARTDTRAFALYQKVAFGANCCLVGINYLATKRIAPLHAIAAIIRLKSLLTTARVAESGEGMPLSDLTPWTVFCLWSACSTLLFDHNSGTKGVL